MPKNTKMKQKRRGARNLTKKTPLKKEVEEAFRDLQHNAQRAKRKHPYLYDTLDCDHTRIKRRIAATAKYAAKVKAEFSEICPDREDVFSITEDWIYANSLNFQGYDYINEQENLEMGAAIWMLDRLSEQHDLKKAIPILGEEDIERSDSIVVPNVHDPCYGCELIRRMVDIIRNRNADCEGIRSQKCQRQSPEDVAADDRWRYDQLNRVLCDNYTVSGRQNQDVESRKRFDRIMSMINDEAKQQATAHFEEKMWEWTRRYFQFRTVWVEKEAEKYELFAKLSLQVEREFQEVRQQKEKNDFKRRKQLNVIDMNFSSHARHLSSDALEFINFKKEYNAILAKKERLDQLSDEITELQQTLTHICYGSHRYALIPDKQAGNSVKDIGTEVFTGFAIDDPYEICFALLYLLDTGDDLPWLYFPGVCVMKVVAAMLPWHEYDFDETEDCYWCGNGEDEYHSSGKPQKQYKALELKDWYRLDYMDKEREQEGVNLAQVVYRLTGCLMPRDLHRYDSAVEELERYGITGKKLQIPLLYCLNLLGCSRHEYLDIYRISEPLPEPDVEEATDEQKEPESIDELKALIRSQKEEIKSLKRTAYHTQRQSRDVKEEMQKQKEEWKQEQQELKDLRELVFHQQENIFQEDQAEEESAGIKFPCHTEHRIVVFGGHETWLKAIRPLLPDVRFIERDAQPNENMIRKADIVWIQTNALAHKRYYAIINEARKYKIPVRYFTFASAERCARQLVEADSVEATHLRSWI